MLLGSLLDLGADFRRFEDALKTLDIDEWEVAAGRVKKLGLSACDVTVSVTGETRHRHLADIIRLIDSADLPKQVAEKSLAVFRRLAEAEAAVHGCNPEEVHFHEVGANDAIIDIVGTCLLLDMLGIEKVYASELHLGTGFTKSEHGMIPVPAPATLKLIEGIPSYSTGIRSELVTPTGAALLKELAAGFGPMPRMTVQKVGHGAGKKDLEIPNLLRAVLGEQETGFRGTEQSGTGQPAFETGKDFVGVLETTIDDMNPEHHGYLSDRLFEAGALDVFLTPILMKKGRPGINVTVLAPEDLVDKMAGILFTETTTFGVRTYTVERKKLPRQNLTVSTEWGDVRVKVGFWNNEVCTVSPEYDDCARIARHAGVPLKQVYERARRGAEALL